MVAREWFCFECGARLKITSNQEHGDGPSNYVERRGVAVLQPDELNWEGLREERGWKSDSNGIVTCPKHAR